MDSAKRGQSGSGGWYLQDKPAPLPRQRRHGMVGRDAELSHLRSLVDPASAASRVQLVLGDAGIGKSALLAEMTRQARMAGARVLSATGRQAEADVAYACLHELLRRVLASAAGRPDRPSRALLGALGLTCELPPADQSLTGAGLLSLLAAVGEHAPVLVVVDDMQWVDRSTMDVLAFVGRRLDAERVVLVFAGRDQGFPDCLRLGFPELRLEPLPVSDANTLLDQQPAPPRRRARAQVLAQAAGNPLALIELAHVIAADPAAGRHWAAEPLPLTGRLAVGLTARIASLPESTRAALLVAAAADGAAPGAITALDAAALAPAEQLGLVKVDQSGLRFTPPLVRSAVYHSAPFADRAAAHLTLARTLADEPDRRAWHLAAAALRPDEQVASLLETTVGQARHRGGAAAAAVALERAAELSPDPETQARRFMSAATAASATGQADWVEDLATRALAVTADPELRIAARRAAGWALAWTNQHPAAFSALTAVAAEAPAGRPDLAWDALGTAAAAAYHSGAAVSRHTVSSSLGILEGRTLTAGATVSARTEALRLWIRSSADPFARRSELAPALHRLAGSSAVDPSVPGGVAWLLDEPSLAAELLSAAVTRLRSAGVRGASGPALCVLGWTYLDTGRWDDALAVCAEAAELAETCQLDIVAASADLIAAMVLAHRADAVAARGRATRALARVDPAVSLSVTARAQHALGLAALADGSHYLAFVQLRRLFQQDGSPLHYHVSYLGLADFAAAAVRADRQAEGHDLVERVVRRLKGSLSPRLEQLVARARGVLADSAGAEAHFSPALAEPAGDHWPFERAQLQLDYAGWLRRQRRINEAKEVLIASLKTFRQLGARFCAQRAETELRACGVSVPEAPFAAGALSELTPQQRKIIHLASDGLTNREIADRLFLSPHTVSSHLYRSYPKLGVAGRRQLRNLISQAGPGAMAHTPAPAA
jgi:DNA-binding CsgD family transcriptional regulator